MRIVVVLPAPLGPRKPVTEPGSTVKLRSETARTEPKDLVSPRTSTRTGSTCGAAEAGMVAPRFAGRTAPPSHRTPHHRGTDPDPARRGRVPGSRDPGHSGTAGHIQFARGRPCPRSTGRRSARQEGHRVGAY